MYGAPPRPRRGNAGDGAPFCRTIYGERLEVRPDASIFSMGNGGVLEPGGVQLMRLGSGALHSERNHSQSEEMQFIQMWILPRERGLEPSLEQIQYGTKDRTKRLLQIVKPQGPEGDGVSVAQEVRMFASRLSRGAAAEHSFGAGRGGYLYVIDGVISASVERMSRGDAAYVREPGELSLQATEMSELLLVDTPLA